MLDTVRHVGHVSDMLLHSLEMVCYIFADVGRFGICLATSDMFREFVWTSVHVFYIFWRFRNSFNILTHFGHGFGYFRHVFGYFGHSVTYFGHMFGHFDKHLS